MNQKITAVNIADALAIQLTFPKKVTDLFMHAFTETLCEGLDTDGIVKIKGLGTFRIVNIESRESVSVSTGERIVIPSFRKLAFTPEDSITDRISDNYTEPSEPADPAEPSEYSEPSESSEYSEPSDSSEYSEPANPEPPASQVPPVEEFFAAIKASEESEKSSVPEPAQDTSEPEAEKTPDTIEQEPSDNPGESGNSGNSGNSASPGEPALPVEEVPNDEFTAIDVLIATPESLEELHDRLSQAQMQQAEADSDVDAAQQKLDAIKAQQLAAEQAVADARQRATEQASEVAHIQQLIDNIESNRPTTLAAPIPDEPKDSPEQPATPEPDEPVELQQAEDTPVPPIPITTEPDTKERSERKASKAPWWRIPLVLLLLLLVGAACYFVAFNPRLPLEWLHLEQKEQPTKQPESKPNRQPQPATKAETNDTLATQAAPSPKQKTEAAQQPTGSPVNDDNKKTDAKPTQPKEQPAEAKKEKPADTTRPKTHKVRRGDTLTKISMQYYGTKDSVRAIIRANNFKDPNNINEGAVVKLP